MLIYEKVCQYIRLNCADVTLEELSKVFHYNTTYFNRLIQEYGGESFVKCLQRIRLEKAADLLCTTEMTVKSIACVVGYQNLSFFYKLFESNYGIKPMAFREQGKN